MTGVLLAVGLTCIGIGLPLIATERGTWDFVGLGFLVAGVVTTVSAYLVWWERRNSEAFSKASNEPEVPVDPSVPLNRATADTLAELDAIRRRLLEAEKTGQLVSAPTCISVPGNSQSLGRSWLVQSRRILDDAYNSCDELQHRLRGHRRWDEGAIPEMIKPKVEESDDLPRVLHRVEVAIAEPQRLQETEPD